MIFCEQFATCHPNSRADIPYPRSRVVFWREYRHFGENETTPSLASDKSPKTGNVGAAERRLQTLIKCHSSATRFVSHPPLGALALALIVARRRSVSAERYALCHACLRACTHYFTRGRRKRIYRSRRDKRLDLSPKIRRGWNQGSR